MDKKQGVFANLKNTITNFGFLKRLRSHDIVDIKYDQKVDRARFENQREMIAPPNINKEKTTSFGEYFHQKGSVKIDNFIASMASYFKTDVNDANHKQAIERYRSISLLPEVADAIEEYVHSILVHNDENDYVVKIDYKDSKIFSEKLKEKINEEFNYILNLTNWEEDGERMVAQFLIDGCFPMEKVFDENYISRGIIDINILDPSYMQKTIMFETDTFTKLKREIDTFYIFTYPRLDKERFSINDAPYSTFQMNTGYKLQIPEFLVSFTDSGRYHPIRSYPVSILHKALKVANQLKLLEDSLLIYRLTRAPERRVFYVDVGNLPPTKAEEHMEEVMRQYRVEKSYNTETGGMNADADIMSMIEDFWLPRRNGNASTQVDTLSGAQNLGEINDLDYFYKKLWRSLGVPYSRRMAKDGSNGLAHAHTSDITADEVAFYKNVRYMRRRIENGLFKDLLRTQLITKEIVDPDYIEEIMSNVKFFWNEDNNFAELIKFEVMQTRFDIVTNMGYNVSDFVSKPWVAKNILKLTEEDIKDLKIERQNPSSFGFEDSMEEGEERSMGGSFGGGSFSPGIGDGGFGMEGESYGEEEFDFGDDDFGEENFEEPIGDEEETEVDLSEIPT